MPYRFDFAIKYILKFFKGFTITDKGVKCSDIGLEDLANDEQCQRVSEREKTSFTIRQTVYLRKGCSILSNGGVYWNTIIGENKRSKSVCKKGR